MPKTASSAKCKHPQVDVNRRCKDCKQVVDIREKRNKYGNKWTDGFQSAKEARRFKELNADPMVCNLRCQEEYVLQVNGRFISVYRCDFAYMRGTPGTGELRGVVEDVKPRGQGFKKTAAYRLFEIKKRLMKALYGVDVVEV